MLTNQSNQLVHDPVPKNVSKFPIHQTYLTDDAERTGSGGYRFKAPEVWSSARSGKKSIAIRSIQPRPQRYEVAFTINIYSDDYDSEHWMWDYHTIVNQDSTVIDILSDIKNSFEAVHS